MIEKLRICERGVVMRGALAGESAAVSKGLKATKAPRVRVCFVSLVALAVQSSGKFSPMAHPVLIALGGPTVAKVTQGARGRKIAKIARSRGVSRGRRGSGFGRVKEPEREAGMA
jgi:hypothetical protein